MFDADTRSISQTQSNAPSPVDLMFLLDTVDASECFWRELPAPYPLLIEEIRLALCETVGVDNGS
jgi:hypothetical protein